MQVKTIDMEKILSGGIDPEYFAGVLSYYNSKVDSIKYDSKQNQLTITYPGTVEEIDSIVEEIKEKLGSSVINRENQVVYSRSSTAPPQKTDMWEEMLHQEMVFDYGDGHVSYSGVFLELLEGIDGLLRSFAARLSARPIHLPNFISTQHIKRLGLVDEFPHYLFFVTPLAKEMSLIENFQKEEVLDKEASQRYLEVPGYCLKTAACSPLYPTLENRDFESPVFFTTKGTISRRESFNINSFERLTEFHQREIIFVGNEQGAKAFLEFTLELFKSIVESFDLSASISTANDSFFVSNYKKFKLMQLLGHDKYETVALIPSSGANIAFSSFNNHRDFFSKRFSFSCKGEQAVSACLGVGLERLVYAVISHHGMDQSRLFEMLERLKIKMRPVIDKLNISV